MNINDAKTFPLRLSAEFHRMIAEAAKQENKSIHQYIVDVLQKAITQN